jgi:hypothetical protein
MITQEQLEEAVAQLAAQQKQASHTALDPGFSKTERKIAQANFFYLSGQIKGLLQAFGKEA